VLQVLLIDDNLTQLRIREAVLREADFSVSSAGTAEHALEVLRLSAAGPDVIITDHVLPGASGSAFVNQLRQISPRVPVIVISGMAEAESEYDDLNVVFLRKPCPPDALIREVMATIRHEPNPDER
jgi:DNA-binding NtrC family response regulator